MMKSTAKILALGLAFLLLLAGCGSGTPSGSPPTTAAGGGATPTTAPPAAEERPQIYVFVKNRGDLSMWDSLAAGGDRAKEDFGDRADVYVVETTADVQACLTAMYEAAEAGASFMYAGNDFTDNILEVGGEYPEITMVSAGNRDNMTEKLERMYAFQVKNDACFLAGILAADVASNGVTGSSKTLGFIGGMDETVNVQNRFLGYLQGIAYYDPSIKTVYNYVNSWNDPDTARTQALAQFNDAKAEVIFTSAGASANGAYSAASEVKKFSIGDDVNQTERYADRPEIASQFITSNVVNYDVIIYNLIKEFLDTGKLEYGKFEFLGLAEGAVSCPEDANFEQYVSDAGKEKYFQAKEALLAGTLELKSALDKDQTAIKAMLAELLGE